MCMDMNALRMRRVKNDLLFLCEQLYKTSPDVLPYLERAMQQTHEAYMLYRRDSEQKKSVSSSLRV